MSNMERSIDGSHLAIHFSKMFFYDYLYDTGFEPLVLYVIAMSIEAYLGSPKFLWGVLRHPVVLIGDIINFLDKKLNREKRSEIDRTVRGFFSLLILVSVTSVIGWMAAWLSFNHQFGWVIELFLLISFLSARHLYDSVLAVKAALRSGGVEAGRQAVAHIVGRDPTFLDEYGVTRAAIESLAENFSDAVVAPTFWYALFGLPGFLVYKAVNTMDSMVGYKTSRYKAFGMAAARFDDILNFMPARLAGAIIAFAAIFTPKTNPKNAVSSMFRDASKHRSTNAGWPEAAMAGALGIALAGPRHYSAGIIQDSWMGNGSARVSINEITKALYIYIVACLVVVGLVASLLVIVLSS